MNKIVFTIVVVFLLSPKVFGQDRTVPSVNAECDPQTALWAEYFRFPKAGEAGSFLVTKENLIERARVTPQYADYLVRSLAEQETASGVKMLGVAAAQFVLVYNTCSNAARVEFQPAVEQQEVKVIEQGFAAGNDFFPTQQAPTPHPQYQMSIKQRIIRVLLNAAPMILGLTGQYALLYPAYMGVSAANAFLGPGGPKEPKSNQLIGPGQTASFQDNPKWLKERMKHWN